MVNIDKLKELVDEQGIKMSFLAKKIGVPHTYFADIKRHKRDIPDERLSIIADVLHTTPEYLRDETDIKEKPSVSGGDIKPSSDKVKAVVVDFGGEGQSVYEVSKEDVEAVKTYLQFLRDRKKD